VHETYLSAYYQRSCNSVESSVLKNLYHWV